MTDKDIIAERGRSLEEDYFRRKDRELIEKMRRAAAAEQARAEMGTKTGLSDPALLEELEGLGFTPDTVTLLPLVPAIQVAWAEGGVTAGERALLTKLARTRGIAEGTPADRQLGDWLDRRPAGTSLRSAGTSRGQGLRVRAAFQLGRKRRQDLPLFG